MRFTKLHGLGNDYVYINGFEEDLAAFDLPIPDGLQRLQPRVVTGLAQGAHFLEPPGSNHGVHAGFDAPVERRTGRGKDEGGGIIPKPLRCVNESGRLHRD